MSSPSQYNILASDMSAHKERVLHAPCRPKTNTYAYIVDTQTHRGSSWRVKQIRNISPMCSHAKTNMEVKKFKSSSHTAVVSLQRKKKSIKKNGAHLRPTRLWCSYWFLIPRLHSVDILILYLLYVIFLKICFCTGRPTQWFHNRGQNEFPRDISA